MRRQVLKVFGWMAAWLPCMTALAMSPSQQEWTEALHSKPNLDRGAELFRICAACHGPAGGGTVDGGVPRIAGQHASVLAKQLVYFRYHRRWDPRMEHFADKHHLADAQAIADVAAYASQLDPGSERGVGSGALTEHGAGVYARLCRSCHGSSGEGDAKHAIPQIAGQHYEYLRRQIYDAVDGRRPNFSGAHVRLLARLEHDDITGLADYLSRIVRNTDTHAVHEIDSVHEKP